MKPIVVLAFLTLCLVAAAPAPVPTLNPDSGPIGIAVTITGEGFGRFLSTKDNTVLFGKAPGLVEQWDDKRIVVRVPRKAATGPVTLKSGKRTKPLGKFTVELPAVKEVSPKEATPGQIVQIVGRNFGPTMGQKDSEMQFGVNEVLFNGVPAEVVRWRDTRIEVKVPSNATSGPVVVRLASVDPQPDGSCCAPVEYSAAQPVTFTVVAPITLEPTEGPLGTPVVIAGTDFGQRKPEDTVLFNGIPAPVLLWSNTQIRVLFPLNGTSGSVTLKRAGQAKVVGEFRLMPHKITSVAPDTAPVGAMVTIKGENFGVFYEGGPNQVFMGGVPARVFQWSDRVIDVWVPVSAKSGAVVVRRGTGTPKADGTCCAERGFASAEAPSKFTLAVPTVTSITPTTAEIGTVITIKGSGFGEFLKTDERTQDNVSREGHQHKFIQFGVNIARTAVLFPANKDFVKANYVAGYVESWTDNEIKVHVPQVAVPGTILISRGSWDMLPDGTCCKDKEWVESTAGDFTPTGLDKVTKDYLDQIPTLGTMP